mmetsp:Transcript_28315/g.57882  ORF Transcript_28315/g.57882 Transcript_28315/m.57882 type:complete len:228 (-) Transcript_28315:393-1076(-)
MRSTTAGGTTTPVAAALLCLLLLADGAESRSASSAAAAAFVGRTGGRAGGDDAVLSVLRGGATAVDEGYDSDFDAYDSEEAYDDESEEEEEEVAAKPKPVKVVPKKLSESTARAAKKSATKKRAATKAAVSATMTKTRPRKKSTSLTKMIPYIVRASLNPMTLFAMIRAYFASLINIDYLKEDSSQTLRSALEDKAKKQPGGGGRKAKRTFKPGQAKTLSDLPQLSA